MCDASSSPGGAAGADQGAVVLAVLAGQVGDGGGDTGAEQALSLVQVTLVDRLQQVVVPGGGTSSGARSINSNN